jgi:hypothetical protein
MSSHNISAIPTKFHGVMFRSRLEARWAAFFHLVGWTWEYEPYDLNGYIPDFQITWISEERYLLEVKPIEKLTNEEVEPVITKARKAGYEGVMLVAGTGAAECNDSGTWFPFYCDAPHRNLPIHPAFFDCNYCKRISLARSAPVPELETFVRACQGCRTPFGYREFKAVAFDLLWKQAGNLVQYKGPEAQP